MLATARSAASAAVGGPVGCFDDKAYGAAAPAVRDALESLKQGEVSSVIEGEDHWFLIEDKGTHDAEPARGQRNRGSCHSRWPWAWQ